MADKVELAELLEDNNVLYTVQGKELIKDRVVTISGIYRPGLELTGYLDFYSSERTQLLGRTEISCIAMPDHETHLQVSNKMAIPDTSCFLISYSLPISKELTEAVAKNGIPILATSESTTHIMGVLTQYL